MSEVPSAMCWMPSPLYSRRNSSIWLLSSWLSFRGMRILPHGLVIALENSPVCLPSMSKYRIRLRHPLLPVGMEVEIDLVERPVDSFPLAVAIDEEQPRSTDSFDCRD